jgi:circadian clock protein KaiC
MALQHDAPLERVSSGIARLDEMLSDKGFYRGSTILVSGTAGTGKTSLAAHFLDAACRRGERCLCFLFEESPAQLLRNMRSNRDRPRALDWRRAVAVPRRVGHPDTASKRISVTMYETVAAFKPTVTVIDPVTNLMTVGTYADVQAMLTRMIDQLEDREHHGHVDEPDARTDRHRANRDGNLIAHGHVMVLANDPIDGRHRRGLYVLKSRGMAHSNELREFALTDQGLTMRDAVSDPRGSRLSQNTLWEGRDQHAVA